MKGQKNHFELYKIDGVGVDLSRFYPTHSNEEKNLLRKTYGYSKEDFILLYTAEFIARKNHSFLLAAIPILRRILPTVKAIMPGKGILLKQMKIFTVNLEIDDVVWFPGYRHDIPDLCRMADVHVATSLQEGQGLDNVEAMASGLPVIASDIRGHRDVVIQGRNGFLFTLDSAQQMIDYILLLHKDSSLRSAISQNNIIDAQKYSVQIALNSMKKIYKNVMGGGKAR